MDKPYLPVQFDELKLIKKEDFLLYLKIKTVGKIFGNALPRKGLKKKPKLQKEDKIGLIDVQKYKQSQPIAYWKDSLIVLDFDLVPDMPRTLYNASTVQVLGEISEIQNNFLYMTVHFVRDFSTINVDRYLEAIGKRSIQDIQDIQYPNMYLRRQMIDTILSPSSCALLSNAPLHQSDTGKRLSDVLIYLSINPKYSISLLGRFTLIIHQNYISRTLVECQLYTDCFAYSAQMNVAICTI